jgi:hypothetical protein
LALLLGLGSLLLSIIAVGALTGLVAVGMGIEAIQRKTYRTISAVTGIVCGFISVGFVTFAVVYFALEA